MIKLDINTINIKIEYEDYIYILNKNNNKVRLKEIDKKNNIINFLDIIDNNINIYNNKNFIDTNFLNRLIKVIESNNLINNVINIEYFKSKLYNILLSNNIIALCNSSINLNNIFILNVLLLDTNTFIGTIKILNNDIIINVDNNYYEECLKLVKEFITLYTKKNYKIKVLSN